jgi:DNA polymerase I
MENKKLLIIDTFYFLHRSFHGFPKDLVNQSGIHTNICYGFSKALLDLIFEFSPTHIVCSWESEELPSFRKILFEDYQKTRIKMIDEEERIFSEQLPWVIKIIEAFNIPRVTSNGFEGDDVIGTVATMASSNDCEVVIATADQDMLQLINEKVKVFRPARPPFLKKKLFDSQIFKGDYGFEPVQMIDYKSLKGDSSDNIPGVKGIGDKTAVNLIKQFNNLDNLYSSINEVLSPAIRKKLEENREMAFLSRQLATIVTNIPLDFNLDSAIVHDCNVAKAKEIFEFFDFKSLMGKLKTLENIKNIKDLSDVRSKKKEDVLQSGLF